MTSALDGLKVVDVIADDVTEGHAESGIDAGDFFGELALLHDQHHGVAGAAVADHLVPAGIVGKAERLVVVGLEFRTNRQADGEGQGGGEAG